MSAPALVADIGGTRARFALAAGGVLHAETELAVADHPDPAAAVSAYLESAGAAAVRGAVFAIAAPVAGPDDAPTLTNGTWRFRRDEIARMLGVPAAAVRWVNDFEALAHALPALGADDWRALGGGGGHPGGTTAVLGPGTGLGVAALLAGGAVVSGEGGHASLAPADDLESAILGLARRRFGHVSAERLLSGTGLPLLHELRTELAGRRVTHLPAADLVAGAHAGDPDCAATIALFCAWLGGFAGSVALAFGATGGVWLGGGILPRLGPLLDGSEFRPRFEAKGRLNGYLARVPTRVILCPAPALRGAARLAAQMTG